MTPLAATLADYAPRLARMTPEARAFLLKHPFMLSPAMLMRCMMGE